MRTITTIRSLLLLAVVATVVSAPAAAQMQRPFETSYSVEDAFLTVLVKPSKLIAYEGEDSIFLTQFAPQMERELGIRLATIEQVMFQVGSESESGDFGEDLFSVVVRCSEVIDTDVIIGSGWSDAEKVEHDGRPMYLSTNSYQPSLYFPDDRTMVIANNPRLKNIANMPMTMGEVVSRIGRIERDIEFAILFDGTAMPESLHREMFDGFPADSPIDLPGLIKTVKLAELTARLMDDVPVTASIKTSDAESAATMKTGIQASMELGRLMLPRYKKESMEFMPEEMKAQFAKSFDAMITVVKKTKVVHNEDMVELTLTQEGGMPELTSLMTGMFGGFAMVRSDAAAEAIIDDLEAAEEREIRRAVDRDRRDR